MLFFFLISSRAFNERDLLIPMRRCHQSVDVLLFWVDGRRCDEKSNKVLAVDHNLQTKVQFKVSAE